MNKMDIFEMIKKDHLGEKKLEWETTFEDVLSDIEEWSNGEVTNLYLYWSLASVGAKNALLFLVDFVKEESKFEKTFSFTVFMNTFRKEYFEALEVLLDKGYDINKRDHFDKSIAHYLEDEKGAEFFEKYESNMSEKVLDEYKGKSLELLFE